MTSESHLSTLVCVSHPCSNQVEAAGVLLEHGVDVNSRNVQEHTALTVAAGVGHHKVVKLLADHQQVDLHAQVHIYVAV